MRGRIFQTTAIVAVLAFPNNVALAQNSAESPRAALLNLASRTPLPENSREQVDALVNLVALEVSTAPTGSSTGGFTFVFDDSLGVFTRSSSTFGPSFAERSLTTGRGKISVGVNWLHANYDTLRDMDIGNILTGRKATGAFFPIDSATTALDLSSDTVVTFGTFGVTNDLDVGVALPVVRVSVAADLRIFAAQGVELGRLSSGRATSSGLGDVVISGKYHFWHKDDGGLAAQIEVKLPTGDEDGLRGLGLTRTLASAIWSRGGRVAPHMNLGYEFWSREDEITPRLGVAVRHQVRYALGAEFQAHPRLTANLDLIGRHLFGGGRPDYALFLVPNGSLESLVAGPESLDVISLAPGLKWNVYGTLLFNGTLLTSLENDALRAHVVPVVGLDWAF